jgi:pyruvate kinase
VSERAHRTRIVCTLGPACESPDVLAAMLRAGMDVARVNLSHGDFEEQARAIAAVRDAARAVGRRIAVLADLPGPKLRLGDLATESIRLRAGETITLTTDPIVGDANRVSVSFPGLPQLVEPGAAIFVNDGLVRLEVRAVEGGEVRCRVVVGGEIRSRKGLNLPGASLGGHAFTERDRACLAFALEQGIELIGQSFVESADDVRALRAAAAPRPVFVLAKIERARALGRLEEILDAADGILIARGDLGVEIPIEDIAAEQKRITRLANLRSKPVVTATQMLESMMAQPRPTRAEATDVANAILDGSDAVMLSGESAVGRYPVEAVAMLAAIAGSIERQRPGATIRAALRETPPADVTDLLALSVDTIVSRTRPAAIFLPTHSGATARRIARFRPDPPVVAFSREASTCRQLQLTWGVEAVQVDEHPDDWQAFAAAWVAARGLAGRFVLLAAGPSTRHPEASHRIELLDLERPTPTRPPA